MVARGDYSHLFAILQYGISMAWNGLVIKFYANQFLGKALGFLLHECFLADKLGLVELAEHTESGHDRCYLVGQFIAIERQSHLKSRSEEHTSELQSRQYLVCRLLLEK